MAGPWVGWWCWGLGKCAVGQRILGEFFRIILGVLKVCVVGRYRDNYFGDVEALGTCLYNATDDRGSGLPDPDLLDQMEILIEGS